MREMTNDIDRTRRIGIYCIGGKRHPVKVLSKMEVNSGKVLRQA